MATPTPIRIMITGAKGSIGTRIVQRILDEEFPQGVDFMLAQDREGILPWFPDTPKQKFINKNLEEADADWWFQMQDTYNIDTILYLESSENYNVYQPDLDLIKQLELSDTNFISYLRNDPTYPLPVDPNDPENPEKFLKIAYISTDKMYINDEFPHELNPIMISQPEGNPELNTTFSVYAAHKIQTELTLTGLNSINLRIVRPISIACAEQGLDFPLTKTISEAMLDNDLYVFEDGLRGITFTDILDLADFLCSDKLFDDVTRLKLVSRIINFSRYLNYSPENYLIEKIKSKIESSSFINYGSNVNNFPYIIKTPQVENMIQIYEAKIPIEIIIENIRKALNPALIYSPLVVAEVIYLPGLDGVLRVAGTAEPLSTIVVYISSGLTLTTTTDANGNWEVSTPSPIVFRDSIYGVAYATTPEAIQYDTVLFEIPPYN